MWWGTHSPHPSPEVESSVQPQPQEGDTKALLRWWSFYWEKEGTSTGIASVTFPSLYFFIPFFLPLENSELWTGVDRRGSGLWEGAELSLELQVLHEAQKRGEQLANKDGALWKELAAPCAYSLCTEPGWDDVEIGNLSRFVPLDPGCLRRRCLACDIELGRYWHH